LIGPVYFLIFLTVSNYHFFSQHFFSWISAQVRKQSVHRMAGWKTRRRPVVTFFLPALLLASGAILSGLWLVEGGSIGLSKQDDREDRQSKKIKRGYTTAPQKVEWRMGRQAITGQVTLTLLEANPEDDTLRASLHLASLRGSRRNPPSDLWEKAPGPFVLEVRASWQKGTSCPTLILRIPALELPAESGPLPIPSFALKVEETEAEIPQLLCSWTRQINAGRSRLGILRALNHILLPPVEVSLDPNRPSPVSTGDLDF